MRTILLLVLSLQLNATEIIVKDKVSGVVIAADAGPKVTLESLQLKTLKKRGIIFNPAKHEIIINEVSKAELKRQRQDNFNLNHPKKDEYLLKLIKQYIKRNEIDPGV